MKMDFDFEDGESIVQSLTRKVMSVIDKLRTSPKKCTNHLTNNAFDHSQFKDGETLADPASPEVQESVKTENHENKSNQKTHPKQAELGILKQSGNVEVDCSDIPGKDIRSHDTLQNNTFCKSRDLPSSQESLNLSTSFSLYVLDASRAKRLHTALGFSESLRKMYLNNSSDSEDDSKSSSSSSQSSLQWNSDRESTDEESIDNTRGRSNNADNRPERTGADTTRSRPSQNFDSCSSGTFNKTGVIENGSNLTRCRTDISNCSDFVNESSNLSRYSSFSSDSDAELVKIRYDTSSSVENTSNISDLNESDFSRKSLTEEFKHDIDYLAKSAYRTSTPDSVTAESVESSKASGEDLSVSDKKEVKSRSRDPFLSMTDSLFLLPRKSFVHGLSPLCRVPTSSRENNSSSHMRVRRSLVFVSPSNSFLYSKARDEIVPTDSQEIQANRSSCNKTADHVRYSEKVLPKCMFRDETEEAVYYLITKYLENSQCKW